MQYASGKVIQGKSWRGTMSGLGKRWVEPFAGGLGAYQQIALSYSRALISDLSPVMVMWQAVKNGWLPNPNLITEDNAGSYRETAFGPNPTPQSVYALHAMGFRGMARGQFGRGSQTPTSGRARLGAVGEVLRTVPTEIRQCDYKLTLAECGRGDVVYLDPPYSNAAGGVDRRSWINPAGVFDYDDEEMLRLAEDAVGRGAVVFISHYDDRLDPAKWRAVRIHADQSTARVKGESQIKVYHEYLYVDIRSFYYFDFKQGADKTKPRTNRTSKQAATRVDLLNRLGPRCEATGKLVPKYLLDLAHHPDHPYSELHDSTPEHCLLLNKMFHAALDEGVVSVVDSKWAVPEELRQDPYFEGADGQLVWRFRK
jgi:DNA adenine methylase